MPNPKSQFDQPWLQAILDGARDYDDDRAPGLAAELLCLALVAFNIVAWGGLIWLVLQ